MAVFNDSNPNATVADFSPTVDWGDGTSDSSTDSNADASNRITITAAGQGHFNVYGPPRHADE